MRRSIRRPPQDPLVWVGFAAAILSSFGSCAALMVIRLSTEREKHLPLCQKRLFFIGAWCNLVCEVGLTSVALALAPLSLISPVSGLTIVFGASFAWFGLFGVKRERIAPVELVALAVTVGGVGISAVYGPSGDDAELDSDDLWAVSERLIGWPHLVYALCGWSISLSWIALQTFDRRLGGYRPRPTHPISGPLSGITSGWLASYSLSMFKIIMTCSEYFKGSEGAPSFAAAC